MIKVQAPTAKNTGYINQQSQVNGGYINHRSQVNGGYINQHSQVNGGYINPHSQVNGMNQKSQPKLVYRQEGISPQKNTFRQSIATLNNRPPLPGQLQPQQVIQKPAIHTQPKRSSSR